jgi:hypothetical protein
MKVVNPEGIAQDALSLQIERINNEVKRLLNKERNRHEDEHLEYLNLQLDGLARLINMKYKVEFDERENINSLDLHLIINGVLEVRFSKYGNKDDKAKFIFYPHYDRKHSLSYFKSKLDCPNKVRISNAIKPRIDKWIQYAKKYIEEVENFNNQLDKNKAESMETLYALKRLPNVTVDIRDNNGEFQKIYLDSQNFRLTCELDALKNLRTDLRTKGIRDEDKLFTLLVEKGF